MLVHHQPVPANPITVSVRPDRTSTWGWELVANDPDRSPRQVNGPYPTAETAEAARDFAMSIVNKDVPLRVVGWSPADVPGWDDTDHTAPPPDVAVTIQLAPAAGVDTWQLQAADPDGTMFATSQEYQGWQPADAARHWLATLGVMAGNTAANGPSEGHDPPHQSRLRLRIPWSRMSPPQPRTRHHIRRPNPPDPPGATPRAIPRSLTFR